MPQYVDTRTAYAGHVRKVVLLHMIPAEAPGRFLVSIDLLEHVVASQGLIRHRLAPRVTRKVVLEPMEDAEARAAAAEIGRASGTGYVCIVRDAWLWPGSDGDASRDAAD